MPITESLDRMYESLDHRLNMALRLKRKANFRQFFKFCTVGAIGTVIDLLIFVALVEISSIHYLIAAAAAFVFAVTNNFLLNEAWTFGGKVGGRTKKYLFFVAVSLVGLSINLLVLYLLVEFVGLHYLLSQIIAVLTAAASNFLLSKYLVFKA